MNKTGDSFENFLALALFMLFMSAVPWVSIYELIYQFPYEDRSVYLHYFSFEESVLSYVKFSGVKDYFINEFLWHYSVISLMNNGVDLEVIFFFISFFSLLMPALLVLKYGKPWMLIFLINPLIVDFSFSQLRSALAVSILIFAFLLKERYRYISIGAVLLAMLVHTASVIFASIYIFILLMDKFSKKFNFGKSIYLIFILIFGALVSIALGPLREWILIVLGDRRAEYPDMSSSFQYSLFWILMLFAMIFNYKKMIKYFYGKYNYVVLSIVTLNVFHGGYSTRFLAATFPILIITIFDFEGWWRICVLSMFFIYVSLQWLSWLRVL